MLTTLRNSHALSHPNMLDPLQALGQDVRKHFAGLKILQVDFVVVDSFSHEVVSCGDMFGAGVVDRFLAECKGALVVAVECGRCILSELKVLLKLPEPDSFFDCFCCCRVFRLRGR